MFVGMKQMTSIVLLLAFSSFFFNQAGVYGLNIPELFTTHDSTVYIPCYVDSGTDHENLTPISWTRVGFDGYVETMMAPDFKSPSNVGLHPTKLSSFSSLVVRNIVKSMSGTYTCHTDKGSASTLVHVLDGESPPIASPCSEEFDLFHGRCLYFSNEKKNWKGATYDCVGRSSSLITFRDVKDLMSFLLNLQKSEYYKGSMWTGHAFFDESNSMFGALLNDAQVSPMLHKYYTKPTACGFLSEIKQATIHPLVSSQCESVEYNFFCEQPTL